LQSRTSAQGPPYGRSERICFRQRRGERLIASWCGDSKEGRPHGRRHTVAKFAPLVRALAKKGISKRAIVTRRNISRTSVRRFVGEAASA